MEAKLLTSLKPYLAIIFMQFGYAGTAIVAKFALNRGMNHYIFSVYRNVIAAVCFAPFAFVLERKIRPRMTLSIFLRIMLLALLEPVLDQNLYYNGMKYTTATFSSAMCNILPAITFLLAWILRLESVNFKRVHGHAKLLGTIIAVGGAMIMTLFAGPVIGFPWTKHVNGQNSQLNSDIKQHDEHQPLKGALMITTGCFCWSIFYILQANTLKSYPAGLSLTTLICTAGALQGTALTLVVERGNAAIWSIGWDSKLLAYAYAGLISSGVGYYVSGVVSKLKGPVFVTSFNPLNMVLVAVMSSFILAEQLNVGKVTGAFVIVIGLYLVIWSRAKERNESSCTTQKPSNQEIPSINHHTNTSTKEERTYIATQGLSGENNV